MSQSGDRNPVLCCYPANPPRYTLLIVPGYADHAGRYSHVGEYFAARGADVYALDVTGHGKASGRRGHIDSFAQYRHDVLNALEHVTPQAKGPVFLLGHSLGGLIVSSTLLHDQPRVSGVMLSSPFLGMSMPVPPAKAALARALASFLPALTMANNIPANHLSRDSSVGEAYLSDPLVFRTATARWFTETMDAMSEVRSRAGEISESVLVLQAGDDRIASKEAVIDVFAALGSKDKTYLEYPGFYHEILNEIGKEQVMSDMVEWIEKKIAH
jgi:alpha-beta hydrolase superfamily lysophospholipase